MSAAPFTIAQIERAVKGARRADPDAVVEVDPSGVIRILPPEVKDTKEVDTPNTDPQGRKPGQW